MINYNNYTALVKNKKDINYVQILLCEQDKYWTEYNNFALHLTLLKENLWMIQKNIKERLQKK